MRTLMIAFFLLIFPLTVSAQTEDPILSLPDGQVILSISATERREVEQDLLVATLAYTTTDTEPRAVQDEINKAMSKALDAVKKDDRVKVNTGTYNVYERTDPRSKTRQWHGSQNITLKSKNSEAVLKLVGTLQDMKFNTNGLSYILDPETAVKVQDSLMEAALEQLQTRANRAAKALGKSKAELRDVNVQGGGIPYSPKVYARSNMARMEMAADSVATPVAESGEDTITLSVNARAILKP